MTPSRRLGALALISLAGCYGFRRAPLDGSALDAPKDVGREDAAEDAVDASIDAADVPIDAADVFVDAADASIDGGDSADCACADLAPPRPLAPLSVSVQSSATPTLRWVLSDGADGARVELCRDRACTARIALLDARGEELTPSAPLPAGNVYWRLASRRGETTGIRWSPTWQMVIRPRSAGRDVAFGAVPDFNGDGFGDVLLGAHEASRSSGRAYLYAGSATGLAATPVVLSSGSDDTLYFGIVTASVGDVNGDGFADAVVGAPYEVPSMSPAGTLHVGAAYVFLGGPTGLGTRPSARIASPYGAESEFGVWISGGDVNLDGYADAMISAWRFNTFRGRVGYFRGSSAGLAALPTATFGTEGGAFSQFAQTTTVAELTGDRYPDFVASEQGWNNYTGRARMFAGSAEGLAPDPIWETHGLEGAYGSVSSAVGDFNGDGRGDLLVGNPYFQTNSGRFYEFMGTAAGLSTTPALIVDGPDGAHASFGEWTACVGDVNADGFDDAVSGSHEFAGATGRARLYLGSASGLSPTAAVTWESPAGPNGRFGFSAAGAGDVNGDGVDDFILTAPYAVGTTGRVYLYYGVARGLPSPTASATIAVADGGYLGRFPTRSR